MEYFLIVSIFASTTFLAATLYLWAVFRRWSNIAIRELAYDAVCYAEERAAHSSKYHDKKLSPEQRINLAVEYMKVVYPFMRKKTAEMYCESILAKLDGPGATKNRRV